MLAPHGTGSVLVFADSPYAPAAHLSFTPLHCSFAASGTCGAQALSSLSSFHFPPYSSFSSCLLFLPNFFSFQVSARAPLPLPSHNSPAARETRVSFDACCDALCLLQRCRFLFENKRDTGKTRKWECRECDLPQSEEGREQEGEGSSSAGFISAQGARVRERHTSPRQHARVVA